MKKPKKKPAIVAVEYAYTDPWTGEWLAGGRMPWNRQRAARSHYSRQIRTMLPIAKSWCGLRTPKLTVNIIRGAA